MSFDSIKPIKKIHNQHSSRTNRSPALMDGVQIVRTSAQSKTREVNSPVIASYVYEFVPHSTSHRAKFSYNYPKITFFVLTCIILVAFLSGMWAALSTGKTIADKETEDFPNKIASVTSAPINPIPLATSTSDISNDLLFNTPIENLEAYVAYKISEEELNSRKSKLERYLKERGSPFVDQAAFIADQPHWKLILAISFAESTLGKKCYMNNCSGIGGSNIKEYESREAWVKDFNGLLERRYKDKTLEQMCGVYVQPCNPHWLVATKQILTDLKERGIE